MYLLATSELRHGRSGGEGSRELLEARELEHDAQVYRAYLEAADRLTERGDRLRRVVLDYELKREYQRFLRERNRGRADSDGRPDRTAGRSPFGRSRARLRVRSGRELRRHGAFILTLAARFSGPAARFLACDSSTVKEPLRTATRGHAWKLGGMLYFDPRDPAIRVENRVGIGYTLNVGNWRA